jgi:hypothetical protein
LGKRREGNRSGLKEIIGLWRGKIGARNGESWRVRDKDGEVNDDGSQRNGD